MIGHVAGTRGRVGRPDGAGGRHHMSADLGLEVVGRTEFEPVTSSVSATGNGVTVLASCLFSGTFPSPPKYA